MFALLHAHHGIRLRLGQGHNIHWHEIVLLPLAFVVVYPDRTLRWLFPNANSLYQVLFLELMAIGGIIAGTLFLRRLYPDFVWWLPLALVIFCILVRAVLFGIRSI